MLTKNMNMDIWVLGTLNLVFIWGSSNEIKFSKKQKCSWKNSVLFALALAFDKAVLYRNVVFSIIVLSSRKWCSSFLKKDLVFQKTCFKFKVTKTLKIPSDYHVKSCRLLEPESIFKIPSTNCLKNLYSFWWPYNEASTIRRFSVV